MKVKKLFTISPQVVYLFVMLIQFLILFIVLFPTLDSIVFFLFLILVFSMVLRWRINLRPCFMLIDETIFLLIAAFYPPATTYLFVFAYYFSYKNKLIYTIPLIIAAVITNNTYYLLLLQGLLFGLILSLWENESVYMKDTTDRLRKRIYNLELVQSRLLSDYRDMETISRLKERQRIAEILHDNLGHELTAAHLSLKAYRALMDTKQFEKADITLRKSEKRLENALHQLKSSVKSIEPNIEIGLTDLIHLCNNFIYPVDFIHKGDISKLKPYIWQLALMSVKEALTNITKHALPKMINVSLEVTEYIVRIIVENDGVIDKNGKMDGNGLRYMRNRLEAVNGSLSIQKKDTFKLIITIPIERGV